MNTMKTEKNRTDTKVQKENAPRQEYFQFLSRHKELYPSVDYKDSGKLLQALLKYYLQNNSYSNEYLFDHLQMADRSIAENWSFEYPVVMPEKKGPYNGALILFHGLNEKSWKKYLPWAEQLSSYTGRPVILFPLAFHMNRAPAAWSEPRKMIPVYHERAKLFPQLEGGSFVNAALSHRIQFAPHRFLISGLHSYYDALDLIRDIRTGRHPLFAEGASVDLFGYSIGATLTEYLMMADPEGLLSDTRGFLFCGGSVLDQSAPVSRTIIDREAYTELFSFFEKLFSHTADLGSYLKGVLKSNFQEIEWFKSLLFKARMKSQREYRFGELAHRIKAAVMTKDKVFPPAAVAESLQASQGGIPIEVKEYDLPIDYNHEHPLPLKSQEPSAVEELSGTIMRSAAEFYLHI